VNPALVIRGQDGKVTSVRYEAVNAMLLNEFLKKHHMVQEQGTAIARLKLTVAQQEQDFRATIVQQQQQIETLTAGLQKVTAWLEEPIQLRVLRAMTDDRRLLG
jgi:hypothetical protein